MGRPEAEELFDVVAVNLDTNRVRIIASDKTQRNADAIETMAIMRRGVEDEFFAVTPAKSYSDGDKWGSHDPT